MTKLKDYSTYTDTLVEISVEMYMKKMPFPQQSSILAGGEQTTINN